MQMLLLAACSHNGNGSEDSGDDVTKVHRVYHFCTSSEDASRMKRDGVGKCPSPICRPISDALSLAYVGINKFHRRLAIGGLWLPLPPSESHRANLTSKTFTTNKN